MLSRGQPEAVALCLPLGQGSGMAWPRPQPSAHVSSPVAVIDLYSTLQLEQPLQQLKHQPALGHLQEDTICVKEESFHPSVEACVVSWQ